MSALKHARVYRPCMPLEGGWLQTSTRRLPRARSIMLVRTPKRYPCSSHSASLVDDDYAAYSLASAIGEHEWAEKLRARAFSAPFSIFNNATGFMEARNASGAWAGQDAGWTEGDMWAYTFDVVHAIPELIERRGGKKAFVQFLDEHFSGGHNQHTNEVSDASEVYHV